MSSKGDPSIGPTAVVATVFTLLFIVIVILLEGYYGKMRTRENEKKVVAQPSFQVDQVRAAQLRQIGEYRWIDANAKSVAIPIERAMELVVAERAPQTAAP